jgi:NADH-quinone oxidoreductase subunit C
MTNEEMARRIEGHIQGISITPRFANQLEIITDKRTLLPLLTVMKSLGFEHMSNITCVDWIAFNRFDVTYNLWSYTHRIHATVKIGVERGAVGDGAAEPEMPTALNLWPQAQAYERELHEMFGIEFTGNPDLSPLFLHNWQDKPPLRKDFDTVEYARRAYGLGGDEQGAVS